MSAVLATGTLAAASLWLDRFVSDLSTSTGLNSLLILLWMLLILAAGYLQALFIGDLIFPPGWRYASRSGAGTSRAEADDTKDDLLSQGRRLRSYGVHFSFVLVAVLLADLSLVGHLGSGALGRISEVQMDTSLRSEDVGARLKAIKHVARMDRPDELPRFTMKLTALLEDPDGEVAEAAGWALAEIAARMRRSMAALRAAHEQQRWEKDLSDRLRETQERRLLELFRHDARLRAPLALLLANLQVTDAVQQFETYLWQKGPHQETKEAILVALGRLGDLHGLKVPLEVLASDDHSLKPAAAWVLGEILSQYDPEAYTREPRCIEETVDHMRGYLPKLPLAAQCAVVQAFERAQDGRAGSAMFEIFDALEGDPTCPRVEISYPYAKPIVASAEEPLRMKILRAVAAIAVGNREVVRWLRRKATDDDLPERYRAEAENILSLIEASQ